MRIIFNIVAMVAFSILVACNEDEKKNNPTPPKATLIIKDIPADISAKGKFTFYSFATQDTVSVRDSATNKWDIAFQSTNIIVNSGISGPGSTQVQTLVNTFEAVTTAPEDGYISDTKATNAIPVGSENGWYNYNLTSHVISPIPGRVFVFKTSDNKYAKIEIISYYKGIPKSPVNTDIARYYSFKLFYQPDGSKNLK